jgi:hypothetical protein
LPAELERWRLWRAIFVVLATLSSRTFRTWMSGGLETALNTLLVTAWLPDSEIRACEASFE